VPLVEPLSEDNIVFISAAETAEEPGKRSAKKVKPYCGSTGTLAHPTAEPGYLCVYTGVEELHPIRVEGENLGATVSELPVSSKFVAVGEIYGSPGATQFGGAVEFQRKEDRTEEEEAEGAEPTIRAQGTWAVTAP
jgi:hypothetical protein